jgi:hypothetical protein
MRTLKTEKRTRWFIRKKKSVGDRPDFVVNRLIYFKPVK